MQNNIFQWNLGNWIFGSFRYQFSALGFSAFLLCVVGLDLNDFNLDAYEKKNELRILERAIKYNYRFNNAIKQDNIYNKVDDLLKQRGLKTNFNTKIVFDNGNYVGQKQSQQLHIHNVCF